VSRDERQMGNGVVKKSTIVAAEVETGSKPLDANETLRSTLVIAANYFRTMHNMSVPDAFTKRVADYLLDRNLLDDLKLGEAFTLRMDCADARRAGKRWSNRYTQLYAFRQDGPQLLQINYVRANDNDRVKLNLSERVIEYTEGHWMRGDSPEEKWSFAAPLAWFQPVTQILGAHKKAGEVEVDESFPVTVQQILGRWFDVRTLIESNRAIMIHSSDLSNESNGAKINPERDLCPTAKQWLADGYSLMLIRGTPLRILLPRGKVMRWAGMIFEDDKKEDAVSGERKTNQKIHAVIIAEADECSGSFKGDDNSRKQRDSSSSALFTAGGFFRWDTKDVFKYEQGRFW
jgi:hypothetical protein